MLLVMAIYAILAVEFFAGFGDDGMYTVNGQNVTSTTSRGMWYGNEYYGTFIRALFSLFQAREPSTLARRLTKCETDLFDKIDIHAGQVLTGESWAEAIARPAIFGQSSEGR